MKGVDSAGVTSTGTPRASAAASSSGGGARPFVTTKQEIAAAARACPGSRSAGAAESFRR